FYIQVPDILILASNTAVGRIRGINVWRINFYVVSTTCVCNSLPPILTSSKGRPCTNNGDAEN
ncbi:MAG: hypothetical protein ACYT04_53705, partial [Nostoc sp.]